MNFDQIKCFLEVTATGNFGRAAENLNVAQSTVSMRIKTLEYDLGHPPVHPWPTGSGVDDSRASTAALRAQHVPGCGNRLAKKSPFRRNLVSSSDWARR